MKNDHRGWLYWSAWVLALGLVGVTIFLGWQRRALLRAEIPDAAQEPLPSEVALPLPQQPASLPGIFEDETRLSLRRKAMLYTQIPDRPRSTIVEYTVEFGDSVFAIAGEYGVEPETVLWSNYDVLKDDPHSLTADMVLKIPPVDGVYYQWQEGDSLETVASEFEVNVNDLLTWTANRFDLADPQADPGSWVMIPGGQREFQQWIVPVPARGSAGVSTGIFGGGACPGGYDGLYGSGAFIWPTGNHTLSGNDYWSGHLAIDIGVTIGDPVVAADSGVIVFAGWSSGGYGFTTAIDHGNGYQTLYAHLSSVNVACGQSVRQGQLIGLGGSSGNSTGPHLHFEVRLNGGFVNPWYVLPAP